MNRTPARTSRLRMMTATAAMAVAAAGLSVPVGAQAAAATPAVTTLASAQPTSALARTAASSARVSGNLSTNPSLRVSARGYKVREGARSLKRVKIRRSKPARHAARSVATSQTVRISLPRNVVQAGQTVRISADVRAAASRGHLSVNWYDASGTFLSWSGAGETRLSAASWRRLGGELKAPEGARVAETVVNVLDAKRGSRVLITNHTVRTVTTTAAVETPTRPEDPAPADPGTPTTSTTPPVPTPAPDGQVRTSTATGTDRIRLPQVDVRPGDKLRFSAEVMAAAGSRSHISVSWFDSSGAYVSWAGEDIGPNSPSQWREFSDELTVPAGVAKAEPTVNVLDGVPGTTISIRNNAVRAVSVAPPPPVVTGPMAVPAGSSLVRDLSRAAGWTRENGGYLDQLTERGPSGEPVLRSTLVDGQVGASSGVPSERNDLQGGNVPLGSVRWMTWHERFVKMPSTNIDRWQMIGPNEIHGHTLQQATVMPEVGPGGRRRLNANAGRPNPRYFDLGKIELNEWSSYKFGIHYTQGNDGWMEMWKDGVRVMRVEGPTTTENRPGYWKFGHYRNSAVNGASVYDVSGVRVYGR